MSTSRSILCAAHSYEAANSARGAAHALGYDARCELNRGAGPRWLVVVYEAAEYRVAYVAEAA